MLKGEGESVDLADKKIETLKQFNIPKDILDKAKIDENGLITNSTEIAKLIVDKMKLV